MSATSGGRVTDAYEAELTRLARWVHDGPLQELSAAGLQLQLLRPNVDDARKVEVDELLVAVRTAAHQLRSLQFGLHPNALDTDDIHAALRDLMVDHGGDDANRRFSSVPTDTLDRTVVRVLFRCTQELVRAAEEAGHERIDVLLAPEGSWTALTTEIGPDDDGSPFVLDDDLATHLEHRMLDVGGAFTHEIDDDFRGRFRVASPPA